MPAGRADPSCVRAADQSTHEKDQPSSHEQVRDRLRLPPVPSVHVKDRRFARSRGGVRLVTFLRRTSGATVRELAETSAAQVRHSCFAKRGAAEPLVR